MPIDWDKFKEDVKAAADESGKKTDAKLANKISSVSRLTDEEIRHLFPDPADAKKLADLMAVVRKAGNRNDKINHIVKNAQDLGGVIVTLLEKLA